MKATEILTKEEYDPVQLGGCEKWGIHGALGQTEGNFREWWEMGGQSPCSFCDIFFDSCKESCILKDKSGKNCFAEYYAVKEAAENNDFPAFHKASAGVYHKICNADYEAYLAFVGACKKEPEREYELGELVQWDGTDGRGNRYGDPCVGKIVGKDSSDYLIEYFGNGKAWDCNSCALRLATDDEIDEYFTVELDGVRCRFYENSEGNIFYHAQAERETAFLSGCKSGTETVKAILKKAGIPIMSFANSKGVYQLPKEKK